MNYDFFRRCLFIRNGITLIKMDIEEEIISLEDLRNERWNLLEL